MSRGSSRLIGADTNPGVIGGLLPWSLSEKDWSLTLTMGRPPVATTRCTVPGHQRPLPKRTIHTQTAVPGFRPFACAGSITWPSGFVSEVERHGQRGSLHFKFARKIRVDAVEKLFLRA